VVQGRRGAESPRQDAPQIRQEEVRLIAGLSELWTSRSLCSYAVRMCSHVVRPSHTEFPPSLLDLPYPLPVALEANIYFLTVPRPPTLTRRDEEREAQLRDAPPAYCEEVDLLSGETVLEVGANDADIDVRAYERLTHAAPLVTEVRVSA
jgi:hypothetical protein